MALNIYIILLVNGFALESKRMYLIPMEIGLDGCHGMIMML